MISDLYLKAIQVSASSENTPELVNYWQGRYSNLLDKELFRLSHKTSDLLKLTEVVRPATTFGELVLVNHLDQNGQLDEAALQTTIETSVRFLDGLLDKLSFNESAKNTVAMYRKIGLGIADFKEYLSKRSNVSELDEIDYLGNLISSATYRASESLAEEKGICRGWDKVKKHLRPKSFEYWYDLETGEVKNGLDMGEDFSEDTIVNSNYEIVPRRNVSLLLFPPDLEWQIWSDRDDTAPKTEIVLMETKPIDENSFNKEIGNIDSNLAIENIVKEENSESNSANNLGTFGQEQNEKSSNHEEILEAPLQNLTDSSLIKDHTSVVDVHDTANEQPVLDFTNEDKKEVANTHDINIVKNEPSKIKFQPIITPEMFGVPEPILSQSKIDDFKNSVLLEELHSPNSNISMNRQEIAIPDEIVASENFLKPSSTDVKKVTQVEINTEPFPNNKLLIEMEEHPMLEEDKKLSLNMEEKMPELEIHNEENQNLLDVENNYNFSSQTPQIIPELDFPKIIPESLEIPEVNSTTNLNSENENETDQDFLFQIGELVQLPRENNKVYQVLGSKKEDGIFKYQLTDGSKEDKYVFIAQDEIQAVELFDILDKINLPQNLPQQDLGENKGWQLWASALILKNNLVVASTNNNSLVLPGIEIKENESPEKTLISYLESDYGLHGRVIEEVGSSAEVLNSISRLHLTFQVQIKESILPQNLQEVEISKLQENDNPYRNILNKYNRRQLYWQNQIEKSKKAFVNEVHTTSQVPEISHLESEVTTKPTNQNIHFNQPRINLNSPNSMAKYSLKLEQLVQTQAFGDITVSIQYDPEGPKVVMATGQAVNGELKHLLDTVLSLVNFALTKKISPADISGQLEKQPQDGMNMPINDLLLIIAESLKTAPASAENINSGILNAIVPAQIMEAMNNNSEMKKENPKTEIVEEDKKDENKSPFFGSFGGRRE